MTNSPQHVLLRHDAMSHWLGIEVLSLSDGHAQIAMTLRPEMMNGFGMTHGGMVFSLADTAFALACNAAEGHPETITVASGADVTFLKSSYVGQRLIATAQRRQQQGRSGLYDVQVTIDPNQEQGINDDADTQVVAEFRGRSRTIPKPRTP